MCPDQGVGPDMGIFSDLTEPGKDVPGKKPPMNRGANASHPVEDSPEWDADPIVYKHKGVDREFYTIGSLARALGRKEVTIRSWENKGVLPKSPYRSPKPKSPAVPGRTIKGKRLWTREQVEGILRIAAEEKVILNGKPPSEGFTKRVAALFQSLLEQETE
jgi:hypothetical protein